MIFPDTSGAAASVETKSQALGNSLAFDYSAKRFVMVDGSPKLISGDDAARQWLELFIRTIPGRYAVYDAEENFGVDSVKLIGKKTLPAGAVLSEIKREISEGALLCPAITGVSGFSIEGSTINFTVSTSCGEEAVSVEL